MIQLGYFYEHWRSGRKHIRRDNSVPLRSAGIPGTERLWLKDVVKTRENLGNPGKSSGLAKAS